MPAIPYVLPHKGECFLPWLKNGRILPLCNICLFNLLSLASKEQASKVFQSLTERWSRRRQVLAFPRCNEVHWPFQLFDRAYFQHSRGIGFCQFRDLIGWEVKLLGTFQFLMSREKGEGFHSNPLNSPLTQQPQQSTLMSLPARRGWLIWGQKVSRAALSLANLI